MSVPLSGSSHIYLSLEVVIFWKSAASSEYALLVAVKYSSQSGGCVFSDDFIGLFLLSALATIFIQSSGAMYEASDQGASWCWV